MLVLRLNPSIMHPESLVCRQSSKSLIFHPTPRLVGAGNGSLRHLRRHRRLDDPRTCWDSIHVMLGSPAEQPLGRGRNLRLRGHEASNRTNRFEQSCVMNTSLSARGGTVADT